MPETSATIAKVSSKLTEQEFTLGTIECGVGGLVTYAIFGTPEGMDVLGDSIVVEDADEAVSMLDLPEPQFRSAGLYSAKAARAAARAAAEALQENICLVVWAGQPGPGANGRPQEVHLVVGGDRDLLEKTTSAPQGSEGDQQLIETALALVLQALN